MSNNESSKKKRVRMTRAVIEEEYGLTYKMIERYLPAPILVKNRYSRSAPPRMYWYEEDVVKAIAEIPQLRSELRRLELQRRKKERREQDAMDFLQQFSPETLFEEGRALERHFVLHIGPTNSGKTYAALQRLKTAGEGVYLGPLRLLALEVSDGMNAEGIPCTLLTGEEYVEVKGAHLTASTIELADYEKKYDAAVIDEAQMLADPSRGPNWMKAICKLNAREIHVCLAPEAEQILTSMMEKLEVTYEKVRHDRLVPLKFAGLFEDIRDAQPGDALITFSRKNVLQIAAALEQEGISASVIYGALPPASRREEVRRFAQRETKVVVATDAIGMGISLPIRRIIFVDTEKFDGTRQRRLMRSEIKQIAGRAGRYGKYDLGEVLTMFDERMIESGMRIPVPSIRKLTLSFPDEALDYDRPLADMLKYWDELPKNDIFAREDMQDAQFLLSKLERFPSKTSKSLIYSLITCPVDIKNDELVRYWKESAMAVIRGEEPARPDEMPEDSLEECELKYRAYDVYHQLMRRLGLEEDCMNEKLVLSYRINHYLKSEKSRFLKRCRICGKEMSLDTPYNICDECYAKGY